MDFRKKLIVEPGSKVRLDRIDPGWHGKHRDAFEERLAASGTTILEFFLYIDADEQLARFGERLDDPAKNWKISESDYTERARWDDYVAACEDMLGRCSTPHAPWYVIPSNQKWFRNLAVSEIVADTMDGFRMKPPPPTVDLEQIRAQYFAAAGQAD